MEDISNTAGANHSIAIGERNTVLGHHSILIGKDLKTEEAYKLIIKFNPLSMGIAPQCAPEIDINETLSEREHNLLSSAITAIMYILQEKRISSNADICIRKNKILLESLIPVLEKEGNILAVGLVKLQIEENKNMFNGSLR